MVKSGEMKSCRRDLEFEGYSACSSMRPLLQVANLQPLCLSIQKNLHSTTGHEKLTSQSLRMQHECPADITRQVRNRLYKLGHYRVDTWAVHIIVRVKLVMVRWVDHPRKNRRCQVCTQTEQVRHGHAQLIHGHCVVQLFAIQGFTALW